MADTVLRVETELASNLRTKTKKKRASSLVEAVVDREDALRLTWLAEATRHT